MLAWLLASALVFLQTTPEDKAIQYLSREVPAWSHDNHCFSCHNNGDGARALFVARRAGFRVPDGALADTTEWLRKTEVWDGSQGGAAPGFSDKRLARVEFGNALVEAFNAGVIKDKTGIRETAESLAASQDPSGAWTVDEESVVAAPARYGPVLATYMARRILEAAGDARFQPSITRANSFLRTAPTASVMNAAAVVMALGENSPALKIIVDSQSSDGGWGPYANTPTETFDTAIALLALSKVSNVSGMRQRIERGRAYLISMQLDDGGWIETTRPAGGRSYAEHISTCGWATLALLATRDLLK